MSTVTIPQSRYEELLEKRLRYEYLESLMRQELFSPPPIRNPKKILAEFRATGKYTSAFLKDLKKGLARSSYFSVR